MPIFHGSPDNAIFRIPELLSLDARRELIRIPPQLDVPLTPRIRRLIDTRPMRRLRKISQLGLVSLVYPAAQHTRFEHSLGVFRLGLLVLRHLAHQPEFTAVVDERAATRLILASLLHDLGHWPFAHIIEDLRIPGVPHHEEVAAVHLHSPEVATVLREEFGVEPTEIASLIAGRPADASDHATPLLHSILSGAIDIDKMDYLERDSLHAGVPYGRSHDQPRLLASFCPNSRGDGLAISEKGRTAAELMVFARYVMFSEVYWHHAVRSATAMFQRAIWRLRDRIPMQRLTESGDPSAIRMLRRISHRTSDCGDAATLLDGLFGPRRRLYKRIVQLSPVEDGDLYFRIAGQSYPWLVRLGERFTQLVARQLGGMNVDGGGGISSDAILPDAPPSRSETAVHMEIFYPKERNATGGLGCYRRLETVSPILRTLAGHDPALSAVIAGIVDGGSSTERPGSPEVSRPARFDDHVKKVRFFAEFRLAERLRTLPDLIPFLREAIRETESDAP